ncbi:hypothetical protein Bbelb_046750, partial [Branchiostoma belcheri]
MTRHCTQCRVAGATHTGGRNCERYQENRGLKQLQSCPPSAENLSLVFRTTRELTTVGLANTSNGARENPRVPSSPHEARLLKGLGKREQGRVEPVPIVILPPGKSLDAWVEIKEKQREGKLPTDSVEKRSKKKKKLKLHSVRREPKQEFFDFLNMKLKKDHRAADSKHGTKAGDRQRSGKELNVKMLQVHEEINSLQKTLVKLKEQHLRNVG